MKWMHPLYFTRTKRTWTALSLIMIALCLLLTLARHALLATLCFALAVATLLLRSTTPGDTSLVHVSATTVALCNLGLSFLSKCLGGLCLLALVITSAFITGTSGFLNLCSWSRKFRRSTWSLLRKSCSTAHTPLCRKTLSAQFSDL